MKITIDDIKAQFASTNSINLRFKQVADEFNEKVLYRSPGEEPNAMDADIDMADNDIFNVLTLHTKELFVDGEALGGDHLWGSISGNLADQADLKTVLDNLAAGITSNDGDILSLQTDVSENVTDIQNNTDAIIALNNSNNSKLNGIAVSTDRDTAQSLEIDTSVSTLPKIRLTAQVGSKSPNTLVKLNASGLIPSEQLPFGGAYTPIGVFTVAADPGPYDNPSIRNPGTDYTNGEFFSIAIPGVQTEGTVVAVNPDTGLEEDIIVSSGDALLFAEGNVTATDGWYAVSRGGAGAVLASDVQYDPLGNAVISPTSTNVDLALTDLDTAIGTFAPTVIGTVSMWSSATPPDGWMECNGATIDGALNPELQGLVDILNPGGNTTAILPETRGEFVRGWDNTRGVDVARAILSAQADMLIDHEHGMARYVTTDASLTTPDQTGTLAARPIGNNTKTSNILPPLDGGTETRPRNTALMYIIKAFNVATQPQPPEFQINNYLTNKNYILNPTFSVNQRGFAGGLLSAGAYTFDRWLSGAGSTVSLPDVDGFVTISGGSEGSFQQRVETGTIPVGTQATVSWEGTALAGEFVSNGSIWGTLVASPFTFTVAAEDSILGGNIAIGFGDGTVKNVKLEIGSVATPFEYPDPATELAKCQRYYEVIYVSNRWSATAAGEFDETHVTITPKRAASITTVDASGGVNVTGVGLLVATSAPHNAGRLTMGSVAVGDAHLLLAKATVDAEL